MNLPRTADNCQGLGVSALNCQEITDTQRHQVGELMGVPTETMPNGDNICQYQRRPASERFYRDELEPSGRGKRHYSGQLDTPGGQTTTLTALMQSNQQLPPRPSGGQVAGISTRRTKKRLRKNLTHASPSTKAASSEILEHIATHKRTGATETIYEAEEEAEDYPDSQAVADMAVICEKQRMAARDNERDNLFNSNN